MLLSLDRDLPPAPAGRGYAALSFCAMQRAAVANLCVYVTIDARLVSPPPSPDPGRRGLFLTGKADMHERRSFQQERDVIEVTDGMKDI
ncbi:MAG: hypothetical protein FD153_1675 [Rhodospirillaceae bacterium]|nr:MAG: hypothetical protein FD153_1675 [Rhodospirillaceae bacterium]